MSVNQDTEKTCRCGNNRKSAWIVPKPSYSTFGWILVGIGISHPPVEVRFECDKCGEVFERIDDPKTLKNHTYR